MTECNLILGDCKQILKDFDDFHFDVACFSPPYGTETNEFHVNHDFSYVHSRFIPYMIEICRVSKITAINVTQRVVDGYMSIFAEQLTLGLEHLGIKLFDRWIIIKPVAKPKRGNRALTRFEFVFLYTKLHPKSIEMLNPGSTIIHVKSHKTYTGNNKIGNTPYYKDIPLQVINMYARQNVLDPFAGSGTTLQAALDLGKDCTGIEMNESNYSALQKIMKQYHPTNPPPLLGVQNAKTTESPASGE